MRSNEFQKLGLPQDCIENLQILNFSKMTEIQAKSLPLALSGEDVIGQAETGSGKTAAFSIGLIENMNPIHPVVQSLVLCPTRELASQVAEAIRKLARYKKNTKVLELCGGKSFRSQAASLEFGAHIAVGTPGRMLDHLKRGTLVLRHVKTLVLDEADRMLEMGFADELEQIMEYVPARRQTLLFSATFPDSILEMSKKFQNSPKMVQSEKTVKNSSISQIFIEVKKESKYDSVLSALSKYTPESSIVFCATKLQCDELADHLQKAGVSALSIHGGLEQQERDEVIVRFSNRSVSVLVATDVAARGLDIKDISAVINLDLSKDPEVHVHRIGRTGREGKRGIAISLYTSAQAWRVKEIESYMGVTIPKGETLRGYGDRKPHLKAQMATIKIFGGKKAKIRPGDILGALTKDAGVEGKHVGKINIFDFHSYVAISKNQAVAVQRRLLDTRIKNKNIGSKLVW